MIRATTRTNPKERTDDMKKYFLLTLAALALLLISCACGNNYYEEPPPVVEDVYDPDRILLDGTMFEQLLDAPAQTLQLSPLTPGEELAVLHTNHGDITLRFFPEEAPLAVENFVTHARNGFYDGLIFHRVDPGFMIQGGCPQGTGGGGESIWGGTFGLERSFNLHHFHGAVAMGQLPQPGTIGSQFYIVQNSELHERFVHDFNFLIEHQDEIAGAFSGDRHIYVRDVHPADALEHFITHGGTPWLDWRWHTGGYGHTVFAHVVTGMDVVDSIATTPREGERPIEDVIINEISFFIYGE